MKSIGWITKGDYLKAVKEIPKIYKTSLAQNIAPGVVDEVLRRFKGKLGDIRTGGYEIYTTIDMKQQAIAKEAVDFVYHKALKTYKENAKTSTLSAGFVAVESGTGDILAMVGGTDYEKSAFNRVTQSKRQPGSAFKPFIYQTALDMGYNPATPLTDLARTFQYYENGKPKVWSPKNYEGDYKGFVSFRESLVHSRNLATINQVSDLGVSTIRKRLSFLDVPHIPRDMSIALGNLGLSPLKMAQIFSVFANKGHMVEPRLVSKIVSKEGAVIYETRPKEIEDFTTPEQAYLMTDVLMDVVKRGTGKNARVDGIELAGKTGTTNNNIDVWFCGYSPTIEVVVWLGRDDNKRIGAGATGGALAAPAFAYYFKKLLKLYPDTQRTFDIPQGVFRGEYDGRMELYTKQSPLPRVPKIEEPPEESLSEDETYVEMLEDDTEIIEDVDPDDTEIGMAPTINIDDEPLYEEEENDLAMTIEEQDESDPLHPSRKAPLNPASDDSGSLF
jgi:penicillin-binding protein 1A